jgi:hypothetical protein
MATANVTLGIKFNGVDRLGADPDATIKALKSAFAWVALGYDPTLIEVSPAPVTVANDTSDVESGDYEGDEGDDYGEGDDEGDEKKKRRRLGYSTQAPGGRRLLREGGTFAEQLRGWRAAAVERLLQQLGADGKGVTTQNGWSDSAYGSYTGLSPTSVQMLTRALRLSCGPVKIGEELPGEKTS